HSPVGSQQAEIQRIVPFAGSWFNHKYEDRSRWGNEILDAVVASHGYDLVIFDRNSSLEDDRYKFPNRFAHITTPAIDHQPLLDIQRLVDVSINLNSVSNSSSMFANRAIELQAQGTFVLSNYNVGLNSRYPHVHMSNGFTDTLAALNNLSDHHIREIQAAGIRSVFSNDLALMRIAKIIETVGSPAHIADPRVVILTHGDDEHLGSELERQTYGNIVDIVEQETVSDVRLLQKHADIIVHVGTDFEYAPTHVEDLVNAFRYTDARTVEKLPSGAGRSTRHTYAEPTNVSTMGAEFIADIPAAVIPRRGYRIDEI